MEEAKINKWIKFGFWSLLVLIVCAVAAMPIVSINPHRTGSGVKIFASIINFVSLVSVVVGIFSSAYGLYKIDRQKEKGLVLGIFTIVILSLPVILSVIFHFV